jgi:hypothetical protein
LQNGGAGYNWPDTLINQLGNQQNTCGEYFKGHCNVIINRYKDKFIYNKTGLVFGSQSPWAEAALLKAGASMITTIEYQKITTNHTKLNTLHPLELNKLWRNKQIPLVDFAFSFSSFEHDGLGRYGDVLNPFADLESIMRIHCLLKPNGILFLGLPTGPDAVVWNKHRIYGRKRLTMILNNWEALDLDGHFKSILDNNIFLSWDMQPIWVLQKKKQKHIEKKIQDNKIYEKDKSIKKEINNNNKNIDELKDKIELLETKILEEKINKLEIELKNEKKKKGWFYNI